MAEPILSAGGRALKQYTEAFVGIDAAKMRNAIAVAEAGRDGEVRYLGEVDASSESMRRIVRASGQPRLAFCSVAGDNWLINLQVNGHTWRRLQCLPVLSDGDGGPR